MRRSLERLMPEPPKKVKQKAKQKPRNQPAIGAGDVLEAVLEMLVLWP